MPDTIAEIAQRHGFSPDAARAVAEALRHGGGRMASSTILNWAAWANGPPAA